MAAFVSACGDTVSEQSDGPNDEIPPESVINAQELIKGGKFAEAYAILYADRENEDARAMLEKFAVVPAVTDCKNYTQYNYFRETAFNEQGDAISLTIIDPLIAGKNRETHIKYENTYDEKGNLIKIVERDMDYNSETVTEYEYDALNRPVKIIEDWRTTEKAYDEAGNVIKETITDDGGHTYIHEYTYDERGNKLTYSATFNGEDDVSEEYSYEYNDKGDIVKFTEIYSSSPEDSRDTLYEYTYDEEGRKTKTVTTLHVGSIVTESENDPRLRESVPHRRSAPRKRPQNARPCLCAVRA